MLRALFEDRVLEAGTDTGWAYNVTFRFDLGGR